MSLNDSAMRKHTVMRHIAGFVSTIVQYRPLIAMKIKPDEERDTTLPSVQ